ncbi:ferlin-like protein [Cryptosporidium canis]|uniref:Ferlin-like protein n=1 Tax=Cryptosporidium canis TaxID=195482 RepID=A0ABQ8PC04_9CRYT|nr:ferlin-like protein [Cryptosporidium canis]KAJ1615286.1 ferlin-like protein [Cryptosporidium canis]
MVRDARSKYIVGFTIHAGKGFITPNQSPINPLVVVKCCGREYRTQIKYNKLIATQWDESYSWNDLFLTDSEWDMSFITFEVQSANSFWKNDIIGQCSIQLKTLRQRKNHFLKRYFNITEINDTFPKGLLYLTVYACGPNDTPPTSDILELMNAEEDNFQNNKVDFLNQIVGIHDVSKDISTLEREKQMYNLYVTIYRVEDLLFKKGLRDPFVTVEFSGCSMQSTTARGVLDHNFNECFRFPVVIPIVEDIIIIKLWDNSTKPPTVISQGKFSFARVRSTTIPVRWYNFYGSSRSNIEFGTKYSNNFVYFTEQISSDSDIYLGRMLISLKTELLRSKDQLMPAQVIAAQPLDELFTQPCHIIADIYSVKGIFGKNACVEVSVGPVKQRTEFVIREVEDQSLSHSKCLINESKKQKSMDNFAYGSIQGRVPNIEIESQSKEEFTWDIIISVYTHSNSSVYKADAQGILSSSELANGSKRVAFCRLKMTDIPHYVENKPLPPIWIPLKQTREGWIDMINNKKKDYNSRFQPISEAEDEKKIETNDIQEIDLYSIGSSAVLVSLSKQFSSSIKRTKRHTIKNIDYEIRCYLYACRNLNETGKGGQTNPYVVVSCNGVYTTSSVKVNNNNPTFLECLSLRVKIESDPMTSFPTVSPITISVFSRHSWGKRFIGSCICIYDRINGRNKSNELISTLEPCWIKLKGGERLNHHVGDILVCVDIVKLCDSKMIPPQPLFPELKRVQIIITTTLLQDLFMMTEDDIKYSIKSKLSQNEDLSFLNQRIIGSKIEKYRILSKENEDFFLENHERGNVYSTEIKNPIIEFIVGAFGRVYADPDQSENVENKSYKNVEDRAKSADSIPVYRQIVQWKSITSVGTKEFSNKSWKTLRGYNFEFFKTTSLDVFLPLSPLYDPKLTIRIFEGLVDDSKLVGEFVMPLVSFLPWIPDVDSAHDWISAKHDFSNNIDISKITSVLSKGSKKKNLIKHSALASIALADMEENKEKEKSSTSHPFPVLSQQEEMEELKKKSLMNQGLNQAGIPITLIKSYTVSNVYYPKISQNMFAINIHIPFHFIIVAEGDTTNTKNSLKILTSNSGMDAGGVIATKSTGKTVSLRPSIDSTMEEFLSDIFVPLIPIRKKGFEGKIKTFGHLRGFVLLALPGVIDEINSKRSNSTSNNSEDEDIFSQEIKQAMNNNKISRCYSHETIKYIINTNSLYKRIKGESVYPNPVRVRLYILSALALVAPNDFKENIIGQSLENKTLIEKFKDKLSIINMFEQNIRIKSFYISIVYGSKEENFRSTAKGTFNPLFYICQEYNVNFPVESRFEIRVWAIQERVYPYLACKMLGLLSQGKEDADEHIEPHRKISGELVVNETNNEVCQELGPEYDLFIGSTSMDLTDRWHSNEWRQMMREDHIPIEYRPLYRDCTSNVNFGLLQMWVEIMSSNKAAVTKRYELSEPMPTEVEVRVIIWAGRDIKTANNLEYSDYLFKSTLDCKQYPEYRSDFGNNNPRVQQTDIHYNCRSGEPVFNWRLVYPHLVTPISGCLLQISAYHYSSFGNHEFIGEVNLDLRKYIMNVANSLESIDEDVELPLLNSQSVDSTPDAGFVQVTIQIIPQSEANSKKVGMGRDTPNRFPKLVTPSIGRNWEDFLQLKERQDAFRPIWMKIRIIYIIFAVILFFIIGAVYPALFYQSISL